MEIPSLELDLTQAIGLIFAKDQGLLKLFGNEVAEGFEPNMMVPQEEQKQEVKSPSIEPEKEAAMKQRLLD